MRLADEAANIQEGGGLIGDKPKPDLCEVEFMTRGVHIVFRATPERTKKLVDYILTESVEATHEANKLESETKA